MYVAAYVGDFCGSPISDVITLPSGCTHKGQQHFDRGTCAARACPGYDVNSACSEAESHCCAPASLARVEITCIGFTLTMHEVLSCACSDCANKFIHIEGTREHFKNHTSSPASTKQPCNINVKMQYQATTKAVTCVLHLPMSNFCIYA